MSNEKIFAEGIYFNEPRESAPDFVLGRISFQSERARKFLEDNANQKGYVNVDIKRSKDGKIYCELNTWQPKGEKKPEKVQEPEQFDDEIPF